MNTNKQENIKDYAVMGTAESIDIFSRSLASAVVKVVVILTIILYAIMGLMHLGVTPWVVVGAVAVAPILFALMPDKAGKQCRKISRKIDKQIDALFS